MGRLQVKSLEWPDEVRQFGRGTVRLVEFDDLTVGRASCMPGWRWSEDLRPLAGTGSCQAHHRGYIISGSFGVRMDDGGTAELGPGDAFDIPPGHDSRTIGEEPAVTLEFAGIRGFALPPLDPGDRRLLSLLFVDIGGSTATVEQLGDSSWTDLL